MKTDTPAPAEPVLDIPITLYTAPRPLACTIKTTAEMLDLSVRKIRKMIDAGDLEAIRVGQRRRQGSTPRCKDPAMIERVEAMLDGAGKVLVLYTSIERFLADAERAA
jgi:excisionase family DNA binding protein